MAAEKKPGKKDPPKKLDERSYRLRVKVVDLIGAAINNSIKYGSILGIAYFLQRSIVALAGRTTLADIGISFLGNLTFAQTTETILTGGSILWALKERRLRREKTEYFSDRVKKLETMIDSKRSSSHLTTQGTTRPEDRE
jgi:hypothetical protein